MSEASSTCWTAIQGAAAGDLEARDLFARRYVPVVRSYLEARWRRHLRAHDIDDALQEVFVECFRAGGALERADPALPGGFRAFLYGITRNVASRVEERHQRRRETTFGSSEGGPEAPAEQDLARVFDQAWARSIMQQAWERYEESAAAKDEAARRRPALLRLRIDENRPIRDIARQWSEDPDRLHEEYAQARREFHRALREVVAFHLPGALGQVDQECRKLLEALG